MTLQVQQSKPRHRPQFTRLYAVQKIVASVKPTQIVIRLCSQMHRHPLIPIGSV